MKNFSKSLQSLLLISFFTFSSNSLYAKSNTDGGISFVRIGIEENTIVVASYTVTDSDAGDLSLIHI